MSWKEKTVEQSREEFVLAALCGEDSISELCRKAGDIAPNGVQVDATVSGGGAAVGPEPYHA